MNKAMPNREEALFKNYKNVLFMYVFVFTSTQLRT